MYIHARTDGRLFSLTILRTKTNVHETLFFADDAAVASHTEEETSVCKRSVMGQDVDSIPDITINDYELAVVYQFTYLGSDISDNLSFDFDIIQHIWKAARMLGRLTSRILASIATTKLSLYSTCIAMYGSESWTTYVKQERKLNSFHRHCFRRILDNTWTDKVPNSKVLERAGLPAVLIWTCEPDGRWAHTKGHFIRFALRSQTKTVGHPQLRYKDVCKRDRKTLVLVVTIFNATLKTH